MILRNTGGRVRVMLRLDTHHMLLMIEEEVKGVNLMKVQLRIQGKLCKTRMYNKQAHSLTSTKPQAEKHPPTLPTKTPTHPGHSPPTSHEPPPTHQDTHNRKI